MSSDFDMKLALLRKSLEDLAAVSDDDYPALRSAIIAAGGPGFAEGVRFAVPESSTADADGVITILPPDENRADSHCMAACIKNCLQIALLVQWAQAPFVAPVPPEETPIVPPEETPTVPPEETPTVPPEETPTAPPEETPTVPPEETPTVPPEETPTVPPEETPTVPPAE